ncbi:hypothetical protein A0256_11140 [Mucilaginibacter sp. PAMC 26640]|nr:hypothetical protein A0256_11140 [Mucilaginibacter sp. PAMC 26640]
MIITGKSDPTVKNIGPIALIIYLPTSDNLNSFTPFSYKWLWKFLFLSIMMPFKLTDNLVLTIEANEQKVRLVITNGNIELACRKATKASIKQFLKSTTEKLFNGRLQLHKHSNVLAIILKGDMVGEIDPAAFEQMLNLD